MKSIGVAVALSGRDSVALFNAQSLERLTTLAVGKRPREPRHWLRIVEADRRSDPPGCLTRQLQRRGYLHATSESANSTVISPLALVVTCVITSKKMSVAPP